MTKKILTIVFIENEDKDEVLQYIESTFKVDKNKVFKYQNLNEELQTILSFHITPIQGERVDIKKHFRNAVIVHKKKRTFYTINALNKLIEQDFPIAQGNINYKNCKIDWNNYQNKIILVNKGILNLIPIKRLF
tara:strand:+ start:10168 stop:10569 length:402 start_codon:yes stop_codon:yes gene_type:complete